MPQHAFATPPSPPIPDFALGLWRVIEILVSFLSFSASCFDTTLYFLRGLQQLPPFHLSRHLLLHISSLPRCAYSKLPHNKLTTHKVMFLCVASICWLSIVFSHQYFILGSAAVTGQVLKGPSNLSGHTHGPACIRAARFVADLRLGVTPPSHRRIRSFDQTVVSPDWFSKQA